jgi:hypothetical protein
MTRYGPLWQQGGAYPAAVDRGLLSALWPTSGSTGAAPFVVNNTMQVSIPAGSAAVALSGGAATVFCRWDAAEPIASPAAPPVGQSRIDLIVLQVRDTALDAGANNDFIFQCIPGVPSAGTPAVPAVPNNAYAICQYTVPGGAANLNGVAITDRRTNGLLDNQRVKACMVSQQAAQALPYGGGFIAFDLVNRDDFGMWGGTSVGIIAPVRGWYALMAGVRHTSNGSAGSRSFLDIQLNRASTAARGPYVETTDTLLSCNVSTVYPIDAGTRIETYINMFAGGAVQTSPFGTLTFMVAALLGTF